MKKFNGCFLEDKKCYKCEDFVIISTGTFDYIKNFPGHYVRFNKDITEIVDISESENYSIDKYMIDNVWELCNTGEVQKIQELLLKNGISSPIIGDFVNLDNIKSGSLLSSVDYENTLIVFSRADDDFIYYQLILTPQSFKIEEGKLSRIDYKEWVVISDSISKRVINHLLGESGYRIDGKIVKLYYYISGESPKIYSTTDYPTSFGNNSNIRIYSTLRDAQKDLKIILDRNNREKDFISRLLRTLEPNNVYYLDENLVIRSCNYQGCTKEFLSEHIRGFNAFLSETEARDFRRFLKENAKVNYKLNNKIK